MKIRYNRLGLCILPMLLLSTMFHVSNSFESQTFERVSGVKVGNWFKYETRAFLNSSDPNATFPESWPPRDVVRGRIEVQEVLGTNVTFFVVIYMVSGEHSNQTRWIDIRDGQGWLFVAVASNLFVEYALYEGSAFENLKINDTRTTYFAGNFRNINAFILDSETVQTGFWVPYTHLEFKWDMETGMMVEQLFRIDDVENETSYYHAEFHIILTETNAWPKKEWKVGVSVGDWWKYGNITLHLNSSVPDAEPMGLPFLVANETAWAALNVTEVTGRNVTLETVVHFKNQTETVEALQGDIANCTSLSFLLVSSNLSVWEPISIDGPPVMHEKSYNSMGVLRHAVVFNASQQINDTGGSGFIAFELFWDKFTGILLGVNEHLYMTSGLDYYDLDFHMNVVETNLWGMHTHLINVTTQQFPVTTFSNASISNMALNIDEKALTFNLTGFNGTIGYCNLTIPKALISCVSQDGWQIYVDESPITDFIVEENSTHTFIYFEYPLSSHQVKMVGEQVVPEFSNWLIIIITWILTTVATLRLKKRISKTKRNFKNGAYVKAHRNAKR